ncbi:HET-domain-containing protein, partial [Cladorrhinum sp. PSN259]
MTGLIYLTETPSPWPSMNHLPSIIELDESVRRIRSWMQICQRGHKECSRNLKSGLPTRVVDVGAIDNELIRLHTTAQGDTGPFTALSYCWGDKGNLTTTKDNLNAHGQAILWSCIPQVMKDAIYITRQLGIQYIWIDALCIVQDDSQDWDREAAQMQDIYRKACLVISGTRTGNCHQSLFGRRTSSATNYGERVPASFATEQVVVRTNQPTVHIREKLGHDLLNEQLKQDLEEHPLLSRGWTFQERLLATRTAHFTASEIMWECKESYWCECSSIETKDARSLLQRALQEPGKASVNWRKLVGAYSWRVFTHPQDRLAALEGVASLFKAFDLGSYCFGLWGDHIIDHMLWKAISIDSRSEVPEAYRSVILGPSWSWISTYQRVDFPSVSHPVAVLVGDAPTVPSTLGVREAICYPPSPLKLWTLTLRTKVRRGVFEHEPCQNQECRYRILLESPEPRANWVAVDFYPDIILCPEHRLAGSDLVR